MSDHFTPEEFFEFIDQGGVECDRQQGKNLAPRVSAVRGGVGHCRCSGYC